jgi:hypothetical protein
LHWYTSVVTRRRQNSSKWWHIILLRTSFLGRGRTFSYNPSSFIFSSPAQEVLPLTNLLSPQEKVLIFNPEGVNSPWPLWSLLSHLHLCICLTSYIHIQGKSRLGDAPGFLESPVSKR